MNPKFTSLSRLPHAVTEVKQFRAAYPTATPDLHAHNIRGMDQKRPFDTLIAYDPPNGEGLVDSGAPAADDHAVEQLDTLLLAFHDTAKNVYRVADTKLRRLCLDIGLFH